MDKIFHNVARNGGEIMTIVDANEHKKCLRYPSWLKKPYLTRIYLKLEVTIPKEGLVERWWKKGSSWQRNMSQYLRGCRFFKGGVEWYALPCNWNQVGQASRQDQFGGAPSWSGRLKLTCGCGVQLPKSLDNIWTIKARMANASEW